MKYQRAFTLCRRVLTLSLLALGVSGCAILHHVQVGEIDSRDNAVLVPFDVKVSENGISAEEIGVIAKATRSRAGDGAAGIAGIIALFQLGPRTGNPVYDEHYAERIIYKILEACPSGQVTGLMSVREMRKYPVISGEIVKVTGYCRKFRKQADGTEAEVDRGVASDTKNSNEANNANNANEGN